MSAHIVERLRGSAALPNGLYAEAADTITDLLAALKRARGSVQCAILHQDISTIGRRIDESILAQIDAAIAKATPSKGEGV